MQYWSMLDRFNNFVEFQDVPRATLLDTLTEWIRGLTELKQSMEKALACSDNTSAATLRKEDQSGIACSPE